MSATPPERPIPAEPEALDRPWRKWASVAVVGFVVLGFLLGFVLLPESEQPGFDPFAAICRSLGIPGYGRSAPSPPASQATVAPGTRVRWNHDTRTLLAEADAEEGAQIAAQICVACHGKDGVGISPTYPNLTHQSAAAIFKQLRDYKSGARTGGQAVVMASMVTALDDQQMANVAKYYASLPARVEEFPKNIPEATFQLVKMGAPARAMPPCDSCHGVNMSGPEESPVLLGQSPDYFLQQLQAFADGSRRNDIYGRMRVIARALSPEEMKYLAAYYAPPSQPAAAR